MAQPITWRSLMNVSLNDVDRSLQGASQSITGGFDRLSQVVADRELVNQKTADRGEDALVLNFKEALAQAKSPEEVASLQSQFAEMRAGMGNRGRTAVLGAEDARTATVMDQISKRNVFQDQELDRTQRPINQEIIGLAAQGDPVSKQRALALIAANPALRNAGEMQKAIVAGERDLQRFNSDLESAASSRELQGAQTLAVPINAAAARTSAGAQATQAATAAERLVLDKLERAQAGIISTSGALAAESAGTVGTSAGRQAVIDNVLKIIPATDAPRAERAVALVSEILADPKYKNLPTAVVTNVVMQQLPNVRDGSVSDWFSKPNVGTTKTALKGLLDVALADPSNAARTAEIEQNRQRLATEVQRSVANTDALQARAFPGVIPAAPSAPISPVLTGGPRQPTTPADFAAAAVSAADVRARSEQAAGAPPAAAAPAPAARPEVNDEGITTIPGKKTSGARGGTRDTTKYVYNGEEYSSMAMARWAKQRDEEVAQRRAFARSFTNR